MDSWPPALSRMDQVSPPGSCPILPCCTLWKGVIWLCPHLGNCPVLEPAAVLVVGEWRQKLRSGCTVLLTTMAFLPVLHRQRGHLHIIMATEMLIPTTRTAYNLRDPGVCQGVTGVAWLLRQASGAAEAQWSAQGNKT